MKPTNHISWNGLAGLGGCHSSALSPASHQARCSGRHSFKQQCSALAQLQHWPYVTSWQIRSPRQPSENNCVQPQPPDSEGFKVHLITHFKANFKHTRSKHTWQKNPQTPLPPQNQTKPKKNHNKIKSQAKPNKHTVLTRKSIWWYTLIQEVPTKYHNWLPQTVRKLLTVCAYNIFLSPLYSQHSNNLQEKGIKYTKQLPPRLHFTESNKILLI